jgi:rare lipoprotein A (peptidoglycan hydrolase)
VRTRFIVAVAALIAAAALVAVPGPAGSRPPSRDRSIDPALFRLVVAAEPLPTTATTTYSPDPAHRSAASLSADTAFSEPARRAVPQNRPTVAQPAAPVGIVEKRAWRHDPEISWYGPGFYGSGTACGQRYSRTIMGVAHRTLPCGTMVSFRNPKNGRTITVPVIDRGPYVAGRQWDLSRAACKALDHCYTGPIQWRFPAG